LQTTDSVTATQSSETTAAKQSDASALLKVNFWDVAGDQIYANVRSEFYTADIDVVRLSSISSYLKLNSK
jgi:hypothetical protein